MTEKIKSRAALISLNREKRANLERQLALIEDDKYSVVLMMEGEESLFLDSTAIKKALILQFKEQIKELL